MNRKTTLKTELTFTDLIALAKFKYFAASQEASKGKDADVDIVYGLRLQALEIHLVLDTLAKEGCQSVGLTMPTLDKLLPLKSLPKERLALESRLIQDATIIADNEDVETEEILEIVKKTDDARQLTLTPNFGLKSPIEVAKLVFKDEDNWLKSVKDTVIELIKQNKLTVSEDEYKGGRREAIRFLKNHAFKEENWTERDCHAFINQIKNLGGIVEPPARERKKSSKEGEE